MKDSLSWQPLTSRNRRKKINILALVLVATIGMISSPATKPTTQTVCASWYGPGFYGKEMAFGEILGSHQPTYTVAHKDLPKGSIVLFKNPANGRFIFGTVRDRGPYVKDRDFDIIEEGMKVLDFEEEGVITNLEATFYVAPPNKKR